MLEMNFLMKMLRLCVLLSIPSVLWGGELLEKLAEDSASPIKYDKTTGEYRLIYELQENGLKTKKILLLNYDPFTGNSLKSGHDSNRLKVLATEIGSPIRYDKITEEYQLIFNVETNDVATENNYPLKFDPFDGTPLKSGRAKLFFEMDEKEIKRLKESLPSELTSINQVIKKLGKPDEEFDGIDNIKRQIRYKKLSKTIDFTVQELTDGSLNFLYSPKEKAK